MTVEVHSLGCRLNLAESERLRDMLGDARDLVVVNSCAVTAEAVRQTRQTIRRARKARPGARLLVTGCGAEIERDLLAAMPEVDGLIANAAKLDPRAWNVPPTPPIRPRAYTRAFVAVQNGCDHACTFCVIPQGRGPSRSCTVDEVIAQIAPHVHHGVAEIVLTGVDLTSWGTDLPGASRLGALCEAILARFGNLPRLRLSSVDGAEVDDVLFELLASEPRMMPHLHLSLQSGDDMILKRMRRRHTRSHAIALVERLRARRPALSVGADLIAGFPTESDAMHAASVEIVAALGVVHGHVFPYSPRPSTPAARMPQVPREMARTRAGHLRAAVATQRAQWLTGLVGSRLSVLAERGGSGHSAEFAPVRLAPGTPAGALVDVTPTRVLEGMLE